MNAHDLIQRVASGEDPYHVLAEAEVKPFSVKVTDKQKQISDLEAEVNKAKDADERALKQAKLDAARAELKHLQTLGPKDESTNSPIQVKTLGDVKGSLHYMGACAKCHRQFMSTHERVAVPKDPGKPGTWCLGCASKLFPDSFDKFGRFIGESLQETGGQPNWGDASTILHNIQSDLQSLSQAVKDKEPLHLALALGLLLPQLERLADVSMGRGILHGLIDQGNKARDWALARHPGWSGK